VLRRRRIAFINEKGGSAKTKTTLTVNMGAYLALKRGRRVLAIDMDPQGQMGKVLGVDPHRCRRSAIDLLLDTVLGDPGLDGPRAGQSEPAHNPAAVLPITRTHMAATSRTPPAACSGP
jgi:cellulose biosynthesis protein BcsQ